MRGISFGKSNGQVGELEGDDVEHVATDLTRGTEFSRISSLQISSPVSNVCYSAKEFSESRGEIALWVFVILVPSVAFGSLWALLPDVGCKSDMKRNFLWYQWVWHNVYSFVSSLTYVSFVEIFLFRAHVSNWSRISFRWQFYLSGFISVNAFASAGKFAVQFSGMHEEEWN